MSAVENRISDITQIHQSAISTRKNYIFILAGLFLLLLVLSFMGFIQFSTEGTEWFGFLTSGIPLIITIWPIKEIHDRKGAITILNSLQREYLSIYPPDTPENEIESKKIEELVWKAIESMALK